MENREAIDKTNKVKSWFDENINNMDKHLTRVIKKTKTRRQKGPI